MCRRGRTATAVARVPAATAPTVAAPFVDELNGDSIVDVPLADINVDDVTFQYRPGVRTDDLRSALVREGQTEPIDLYGEKPHRIVDGVRRVHAIRELGWPSVKALVHRSLTNEQAHERAFVKSVVHRNLSPIENANAIRLPRTRGLNAAAIAAESLLSEVQIRRHERLLLFSKPLRGLIDTGRVAMEQAESLHDVGATSLVDWPANIDSSKWSALDFLRQLRKTLTQRPVPKTRVPQAQKKRTTSAHVYDSKGRAGVSRRSSNRAFSLERRMEMRLLRTILIGCVAFVMVFDGLSSSRASTRRFEVPDGSTIAYGSSSVEYYGPCVNAGNTAGCQAQIAGAPKPHVPCPMIGSCFGKVKRLAHDEEIWKTTCGTDKSVFWLEDGFLYCYGAIEP